MHLNLKRPLAFFDLETTGVDVSKDRIVELAIVKVMPDGSIIKKPEKSGRENRILINPEMPIPVETSMIHGIYDEDVKDAPTFKQIAKSLFKFLHDCDLAGYNSNKFDVPMLVEEFLRVGYYFDVRERNLIDVQNIFHLMEQRTLKAGYKFYCGKDLDDAHEALPDTEATYEIFLAQLEKYKGVKIEGKDGEQFEPVQNDMEHLAKVSKRQPWADLIGRLVYNEAQEICFNFGKHKGKRLVDVFKKEPGYYAWMMQGDFPNSTKKILEEVKEGM